MLPFREQLAAIIRKLGGTVKNNDNRIPKLLNQVKELTDSNESDPA